MVTVGCSTDIGKVRPHNEDCFICEKNFAIVADGMGGHNKGEVASNAAAEEIKKYFSENTDFSSDVMVAAINSANVAVINKADSSPEMNGMGTTVVACMWKDNDVIIGNVGDSRCYIISNGKIEQITIDHSLVQKMVDRGQITKEEAEKRNDKNVLYRAVGCEIKLAVDIFESKVQDNDIIVLCTDGLTNCVSDDTINEILSKEKDLQTGTEKLIEAANENGGIDNITVVAIKFNN